MGYGIPVPFRRRRRNFFYDVIKVQLIVPAQCPGLSFWPSRFSYYSLIVFYETRDTIVGGLRETTAPFSMYPETQDKLYR